MRQSSHKQANILEGQYIYMKDLRGLELCVSPFPHKAVLANKIVSPLSKALPHWRALLSSHPDRAFVAYIVNGLANGFRIGFEYRNHSCTTSRSNHLSVTKNPDVVGTYIGDECAAGRVIGPLHVLLHPDVNCSQFGAIPKPDKPGKWRLILDLSFPDEASVNSGISKELATLGVVSVDEIVEAVLSLGKGALLTKIDVKSAFRLIPVHPDDRHLLGMRWQGALYIDCVLPFGLRSAPKIFNAVADALQWILICQGVQHIYHYLDDYLCIAPPPGPQGDMGGQLPLMVDVCNKLGIPLALEKVAGPATCLTFLGIEIDTDLLQIRLTLVKLTKVKKEVTFWLGKRKACKKRELQSLVGLLQHACKVIRPGRIFLRRIIETMESAKHSDHWVRLNSSFRSDLIWWDTFLEEWNGISMLWSKDMFNSSQTVTSDASGNWGCGAIQGKGWFQLEWPTEFRSFPIHVKELLPIVIMGMGSGMVRKYGKIRV